MRRVLAILVLLLCTGSAQADGGLDIYFVRHAETVANANGTNNSASTNTFSQQGIEQLSILTKQLKSLHFDALLVSSSPRAMNTLLPYLKETRQKAEIWPELSECCWQKERNDTSTEHLTTTSEVELSPEQVGYFTFRDVNSMRNYSNDNYADGLAQVHLAEELLKKYSGSDMTILIVGHYHSGQVLLADLLGIRRDQLPGLKNAQLTHLRQGADGHFRLLCINNNCQAP